MPEEGPISPKVDALPLPLLDFSALRGSRNPFLSLTCDEVGSDSSGSTSGALSPVLLDRVSAFIILTFACRPDEFASEESGGVM